MSQDEDPIHVASKSIIAIVELICMATVLFLLYQGGVKR